MKNCPQVKRYTHHLENGSITDSFEKWCEREWKYVDIEFGLHQKDESVEIEEFDIWNILGVACVQTGKLDDAIVAFQQTVQPPSEHIAIIDKP